MALRRLAFGFTSGAVVSGAVCVAFPEVFSVVVGGPKGTDSTGSESEPNLPKVDSEDLMTDVEKTVLAKCLAKKRITLHGTTWCGWCRRQLERFGQEGQKFVPYYDCTRTDGKSGFSDACISKGIKVVPSWVTADGTVLKGTQSLPALASHCRDT